MRKLIAVPAALAASILAAPSFAQGVYVEYGTSPMYGYAPTYGTTTYGYAAYVYGSHQSDLDNGRYTASDTGSGAVSFGRARPDPVVGNNTSRGTDTKGTVDPPARDRDVADAFKKID